MSRISLIIALSVTLGYCTHDSLLAQMPSAKFEPVNHLGRMLGIGYSDGYHECRPQASVQAMGYVGEAQLYDVATFPTSGLRTPRHQHSWHGYGKCNCPTCVGQSMQVNAAPVNVPYAVSPSLPTAPTAQSPTVAPPPVQHTFEPPAIPQPLPNLDSIPPAPTPRASSSGETLLVPEDRTVSPSDQQRSLEEQRVAPERLPLPEPSKQELDGGDEGELLPAEDDELLIPDQARQRSLPYRYRQATRPPATPLNRYMR